MLRRRDRAPPVALDDLNVQLGRVRRPGENARLSLQLARVDFQDCVRRAQRDSGGIGERVPALRNNSRSRHGQDADAEQRKTHGKNPL